MVCPPLVAEVTNTTVSGQECVAQITVMSSTSEPVTIMNIDVLGLGANDVNQGVSPALPTAVATVTLRVQVLPNQLACIPASPPSLEVTYTCDGGPTTMQTIAATELNF